MALGRGLATIKVCISCEKVTMKLSVLVPAYNEERWIDEVLDKIWAQDVPGIDEKEIIVVDDASIDGTGDRLKLWVQRYPDAIRLIVHDHNQGKGAAIRTAVQAMSGDVAIIQDADWEYDPAEYPLVLEPILDGRADCVFGSRFVGTQAKRVLFFWHYVGNQILTLFSNMFTNLNLTDMETGTKAFRAEVLKSLPLVSRDFTIEPEITARVARRNLRIYEVGIRYSGRTYAEGKKITWKDGVKALIAIFRFNLLDRR